MLVTLLAVAPGRASALEPPRPLPGHRPEFVTETDERPWRDCLWASAAMVLDTWTNGDVSVTHQRLRKLSGDDDGGSSLEDLRAAFRRLGFRVDLNGGGNATMTWHGLLRRLKDGGGAVVLGDYGQLPRWFGRWDYGFWKLKGKRDIDNHAVYVERYDPRRGVVWLMDPLGRGDYDGEWLPIGALQRFAWFKNGRVQAVATPAARPAPFAGVRVLAGKAGVSDEAVTGSWGLRTKKRWRFQGADVTPSIRRAADPIAGAARSAAAGAWTTDDAAPDRPRATVRARVLRATAALPDEPGAYTAAVTVTDRRFGRTVARSTPVTAFVPGPVRANVWLKASEAAPEAGRTTGIELRIANSGDEAWAAPERYEAADGRRKPKPTRVVATWLLLEAAPADGLADAVKASPARAAEPERFEVVLDTLTLGLGRSSWFDAQVRVPATPGQWALVIDLVNDVDGSFAAQGSEPAVALFDVRARELPPERDPALE